MDDSSSNGENKLRETPPTRDEVLSFIKKLRPYSTEYPLVRIGSANDGGYLLPNDFVGVANCYSPGVGSTSNFELFLANKGIRSFIADASVDGPVLGENRPTPLIVFDKKFLGLADSDDHKMTLTTWVNRYTPGDDNLILQMDIEGSEYEVIQATPIEIFKRFRIMAIEFHHLHLVWDRESFEDLKVFFEKILKVFTVVHLHPNNYVNPFISNGLSIPPVMEMTFIRTDRVKHKTPATTFPHRLDNDNAVILPPVPLPKEWYSG